ncbi:MAG: diguanylate cyclase [Candidatus Bipolaricaulia bacterium]
MPAKKIFYLDSAEEWPGFEFIYILEGELRYLGSDPPTILGPGDYIARHLTEERSYFETGTDVTFLSLCSPPAFNLMREDTEEFHEMAERIEADEYVDGHCRRLENMAVWVGEKLDLSGEQMGNLSYAAFFHDLGKARVSQETLQKPGKLTEEEWKLMKKHSIWGREMLEKKDFLKGAAQIVEQIHERVDGTGYPNKLKGHEISIEARIIAVVEAYDAMTTDRPYRKALNKEKAIRRLKGNVGTQFDEPVVDAFIEVIEERGEPYKEHHEIWNQELTYLKQREAFLKIGEGILAGQDIQKVLNNVVTAITHYTPFQRAMLTLYDRPIDPQSIEQIKIAQVAYAGLASEEEKSREANSILPHERQLIFNDHFKLSRSYYIPHDRVPLQSQPEFIENQDQSQFADTWHPDDLLLIPMWVENQQLIGLIAVDNPIHERLPTPEMLEPIEMFANLAAIAVREAQRKQQLREMAIRDPLTQLYNRHYLVELIEKEQARALRYNLPLSLIMVDFVGFHDVNDQFGHLEGDRVLQEAAALLQQKVRKVDTIIRYGGDEFLIVMPDTDQEQAEQTSERLRAHIRNHDFGLLCGIAIRTGSSTWKPEESKEFEETLEEADTWMYKQHHRQKVRKRV